MSGRAGFVINQLGGVGRGGSDRVVCLLANALSDRGWDVDICVLTDDQTVDRELRQAVGLRFLDRIRLTAKLPRILARLIGGVRLVSAYRREHPDAIMVSFIAWVNICTVLGSLGRKGGIVLSERTNPASDPSLAVARVVRDACYRRADALVFQTPDAMNYFSDTIAARGTVIGNPVTPDLPRWTPDESRLQVVAACRLEAQKNVPLLLNAFARLHAVHPAAVLTIYGEGKLRGELENLVVDLDLGDCVQLPGHVDDVHSRIAEGSFFVLSSDFEGLPNSLLEAMAMGMPVISTDCPIGGPGMLIDDHQNGVLVKVADVDELAEAMSEFANAPREAALMGERALRSMDEYQMDHVIERWESLLADQLATPVVRDGGPRG
ncbi:MAG: glycosyltransferase [Microbacterium sp.]